MATIVEIIGIAKVSQYLATNAILNGGLYGKGLDLQLPRKLYSIRKNVQYRYDQEDIISGAVPSPALISVSNKLYSLCYLVNEASAIFNGGGGGGSVSPVTPVIPPEPIFFTVSDSSYIPTGNNSKTLPLSFTSYNLLFIRNGRAESEIDSGGSFYTWNKISRAFTCTPAAQEGEEFQLRPNI